jgi:PAS domain S-box-containing protein
MCLFLSELFLSAPAGAQPVEPGVGAADWAAGLALGSALGAAAVGALWLLWSRRAGRTLKESEDRFRVLMDASPDGILVHQDGAAVYANAAMADMLSYDSAEELVGLGTYDFIPPEEREETAARRARREAGETVGLVESRIVRRDGVGVESERSGALTTWNGRPAHLLLVRDISGRKAGEFVREQFLGALEYLPSAVALFDAEERLVAWNSRFARMPEAARPLLRRGATMEELLRGRAACGDAPAEALQSREATEAWVAARMELFRSKSGPFEMFMRGEWRLALNERLPNGGTVLVSSDISALKAREQALRESEAQFRGVFEASGSGIVLIDNRVGYVRVNRAFCDFVGYEEHELAGMAPFDFALPEDAEHVKSRVAAVLNGEISGYQDERRYVHRSGQLRWALVTVRAIETEDDRSMLVGIVQDITARKRTEQALVASEARFRSVFEAGGAGINLVGTDRRFIAANRAFCEFTGYSEEELRTMTPVALAVPDEQEALAERLQAMRTGIRSGYELERRYVHRSGRILWGVAYISVLPQADPDETVIISVVQDITARKQMEEALTLSEARFRDFAEAASDSFWEMGTDFRFSWLSEGRDRFGGFATSEWLGRTRWDLADPEDMRTHAQKWADHRADLEARRPFRDFQYPVRAPHGRLRYLSVSGRPVFAEDGAFQGFRGTATDITERMQAMEETRRLFDAIEAMDESVLLLDPEDRIVYSNSVFRRRNRPMESYLAPGTSFRDFLRVFARRGGVAEAVGREEEWLQERMRRHADPYGQFEMRSFDGTPLLVTEKRLANGGTVIIAMDISALKHTEAQLVQSQKMEAVGQLTGGVAHDFNNLLTVVLGNLNLLRERMNRDSPEYKMVQPAIRAAERGATLTARLLAFSRRQALTPSVINVGKAIAEMTALMRRVLGENIEIETVVDGGLWSCEVDPTQLENALLNMALNARDAMPEGGKLTVEAGNARLDDEYAASQLEVSPGRYVMLSVTDTGVGMSPEVRSRVFDPFFTTKEVGRGTGLGLSMVYGFVKQSGGHISVYSEPGEGTTFKIYLPRVITRDDRSRSVASAPGDERGRGELILVVEDDADVRALTMVMLEDLGYRVVAAESAETARERLAAEPDIALLLTDVVLPGGTSGRTLAESLVEARPGLRVLYMSGYTENAIIHHGRLDEGIQLLQKPFRKADLQRKVRRALDLGSDDDA